MKILLLDDIKFNILVCERKLSALGHKVYTAFTAEDALKELERDPEIELVLSDYAMETTDGIAFKQICHKSLRVKLGRDLPVFVLVTAYKESELTDKAKQNGFMDVIRKPLATTTLEKLIEKVQKKDNGEECQDKKILIYARDPNIKTAIDKIFLEHDMDIITINEPYRALAYYNNNPDIACIIAEQECGLINGVTFYELCKKNARYNDEGDIPTPPCCIVMNKLNITPEEQLLFSNEATTAGINTLFSNPLQFEEIRKCFVAIGLGNNKQESSILEEREKVLLIEDITFLRVFMSKQLQNAGFNVVTASNGTEALDALNSQAEIKAVITDYQLPDILGTELLKQCKAMKRFNLKGEIPCPPFILISAIADFEKLDEIRNDLFYRAFRKPVESKELIEILNKIMEPYRQKPKLLSLSLKPRGKK